jgi:hypothetical protein
LSLGNPLAASAQRIKTYSQRLFYGCYLVGQEGIWEHREGYDPGEIEKRKAHEDI